jgi:hypothetical protein
VTLADKMAGRFRSSQSVGYSRKLPISFPDGNGTCQLMNAVDNPITLWATSHRDLGCPRATLPILDFRIPGEPTPTVALSFGRTPMK